MKAVSSKVMQIPKINNERRIMKLTFVSLAALLSFSLSCMAMQEPRVTIPDAKTLTSRLEARGLEFINGRDIVGELAGKTLTPTAVVVKVATFGSDHLDNLAKGGMSQEQVRMAATLQEMTRSTFYEVVLQDSKEALEYLKARGLYSPTK